MVRRSRRAGGCGDAAARAAEHPDAAVTSLGDAGVVTRGSTATDDTPPVDLALPAGSRHSHRRRPTLYRHPGDIFRVVAGLAVLAWLTVLAPGGSLSGFERDVFRLLNDLPGWLDPPRADRDPGGMDRRGAGRRGRGSRCPASTRRR